MLSFVIKIRKNKIGRKISFRARFSVFLTFVSPILVKKRIIFDENGNFLPLKTIFCAVKRMLLNAQSYAFISSKHSFHKTSKM